jgi:hypothetical protein
MYNKLQYNVMLFADKVIKRKKADAATAICRSAGDRYAKRIFIPLDCRFEKYRPIQDRLFELDFDKAMKMLGSENIQ